MYHRRGDTGGGLRWLGSIISGALFYGIAEIINLLQRIEKKLCVDGGESEKLKDIEANLPNI